MTTETGSLSGSIARAKARLSEMVVQEVSLVDAAANLRRFVVVKGLDQMTIKIEKGMKLPKTAQKALSDAIAKSLDELTKFAEALASATIDDASSVPAEVGKYLAQTALSLDGIAKQYGGEQDDKGKKEPEPTEKRGAKMSKQRMERLKGAYTALKEIMDEVEPGDGPESETEKAGGMPCPSCKAMNTADVATCKSCGASMKGGDMQKSIESAIAKSLDPVLAKLAAAETKVTNLEVEVKKSAEEIAKRDCELEEARAVIAKAKAEIPIPAAKVQDGSGSDGKTPIAWPEDLNDPRWRKGQQKS